MALCNHCQPDTGQSVLLFCAVLRLLGVAETSYTETGLLLGAGPPVRPGSTLSGSFLFHSGSSSDQPALSLRRRLYCLLRDFSVLYNTPV